MNIPRFFQTAILILGLICIAQGNDGLPIKFIGGCEADYNNDHVPDKAILMETQEGTELVVLLSGKTGYTTYSLYKGRETNLFVGCKYMKSVQESEVFAKKNPKGQRKEFTVNKFVITLSQPECSYCVFFWNGNKFVQVYLAD